MKSKPPLRTGISRILYAFLYSFHGYKSTFINEAAFRQELCIFVILLPVIIFIPVSIMFKAILFFANMNILIVELLNSAIETIVDMASPEYHILAKRAKDIGSAAVNASFILAIVMWGTAVYSVITMISRL
ncbi:MAG: diacylglycerol kinase [Chlamydiae bacterium]|nr:MAG: diacylglycerol kinase [Chlamydiota bacterium]